VGRFCKQSRWVGRFAKPTYEPRKPQKSGRGGLAAKQIPHRPGHAPALGLRAGSVGVFIVSQTEKVIAMLSLRGLFRSGVTCGVVAALLLALSPAVARAQSVRGNGVNFDTPSGSFQQVSVNAYIDANGVVQGQMQWEGDNGVPGGRNNPSDPFIMAVTDLVVVGNTAIVTGVVIASPKGVGNGEFVTFVFTDNSAISEPDEVDGVPIDAGGFTVTD
jgi:hypothetical protein